MAGKKCFVVQGFGKKTDYTDGRVLNLDASYAVIKMAVEAAGLECVRADEIVHSGTIDVPMYQWLLDADLVIADLSTNNINAAFELGVRYALRPYTTIVLAEEQFKNPFDLSHVVIRRYKHLGDDIGFVEAQRLMTELKTAIAGILDQPQTDSPVYTFLPQLQAPQPLLATTPIPPSATLASNVVTSAAADITGAINPSAKLMLDSAMEKIAAGDFGTARVLLAEVKNIRQDSFVLQQLALATYKSQQPTLLEALDAAQNILLELNPATTNNPETLSLWGAVHKRLWEESNNQSSLKESIDAYERAFYLKLDHYTGINLAYLLNERALQFLQQSQRDEATADYVRAKRIRLEVLDYGKPLLANTTDTNAHYWLLASLSEAALGSGDVAQAQQWADQAQALSVAAWMQESRLTQQTKLKKLLEDYAAKQASG